MSKEETAVTEKLKEAKEIMESGDILKGYDILKSVYASLEDSEDKIELLTALTEAAKVSGMPLDALKYSEKKLELTKKMFPKDTEKELKALTDVAWAYQELHEDDKALKIFEDVYSKSKEIFRETEDAAVSDWDNYMDALLFFPSEKNKLKELQNDGIHIMKQFLEEFKASPQKDEDKLDEIIKKIESFKYYYMDIEFEKEMCKIDSEILSIARDVYPKNSMKLIKPLESVAMGLYNNKGFLLVKEAFQIAKSNAKSDEDMLDALENHMFNCRFMGKEKEFKKFDKQAEYIIRKIIGSFSNVKDAPYEEQLKSLKEQRDFYNKGREFDEEREVLEEICDLTEEKDVNEYLDSLERIAEIYSRDNNIHSLSSWRKIWDIRKKEADLREGLMGVFLKWIVDCQRFGEYDEALKVAENALKEMSSAKMDNAIVIRQILAKSYSDVERYDEELAIRELMSDMTEKRYGENSIVTLDAKAMEAYPLISLGRYDEAIKIAKGVYEKYNELFGEFNIMTIKNYLIFIKLLCRAGKTNDAINRANALVKKLFEYKPYAESDELIKIKTNADNMLDACILLFNTEEETFDREDDIREETLSLIDDDFMDEIPKVKEDFLILLWKEASGKRFKPSKNRPVPWSSEVSKTDKFFCAAEDKVYRVDSDKTFIFENGWKEAEVTPDEYKKISEADALELVWRNKGDVKKFF